MYIRTCNNACSLFIVCSNPGAPHVGAGLSWNGCTAAYDVRCSKKHLVRPRSRHTWSLAMCWLFAELHAVLNTPHENLSDVFVSVKDKRLRFFRKTVKRIFSDFQSSVQNHMICSILYRLTLHNILTIPHLKAIFWSVQMLPRFGEHLNVKDQELDVVLFFNSNMTCLIFSVKPFCFFCYVHETFTNVSYEQLL